MQLPFFNSEESNHFVRENSIERQVIGGVTSVCKLSHGILGLSW